jgi:hypothetical protein
MGRLAGFLAYRLMVAGQNAEYRLVGVPKIAETLTMAVGCWNPVPESPTTFFLAVANEIGNNLAGSPTKSYPNPPLVVFVAYKGPQFV